MRHPDPELLADLALGEPVADEVRAHAAACATCRDEVGALARAAGALTGPLPELVAAPARVRDAVLAAAVSDAEGPRSGAGPAAPGVPDELATRRSASRAASTAPPARRFGTAWLVGAAAAGLVVGGIGTALVQRSAEEPQARTVVLAQADLDTLDTGTRMGVADLVEHGGTTDLALHTDPMSAGNGYLEVWLINRDGERMVSIGVLEPGRTDQTFAVPAELITQGYVIVDISREPFDTDATHSGDSLVRGTLPA